MGDRPSPAVPGCGCRLCRPQAPLDPQEQKCLDDVSRHGWHVVLVAAGGSDEPAFAYTVGLPHRAGHPELLVSGLRPELAHSVLDEVAGRVLRGRAPTAGVPVEGVLAGVALVPEPMTDAAGAGTATWSGWFSRTPVTVLQLVWPDTSGRYAWQPGAAAALDELQPPGWRLPARRVHALAVEPTWVLPVPADSLAFVCRHVSEDGLPVLFAAREVDPGRGEEWSFHCGADHPGASDIRLSHLEHVVRSAPSVRDLAGLPVGGMAWRPSAEEPWQQD